MRQHTPLHFVLWLGVALLAHILVALFGVLNRWLQTRPSPPLPALRAALLVSCLALTTVALVDATSRAVGWALHLRRRRAAARQLALPVHSTAQHSTGKQQQQGQQQRQQHLEGGKPGEGSGKSGKSRPAAGAGQAASGEAALVAAAAAPLPSCHICADGSSALPLQPAATAEGAAAAGGSCACCPATAAASSTAPPPPAAPNTAGAAAAPPLAAPNTAAAAAAAGSAAAAGAAAAERGGLEAPSPAPPSSRTSRTAAAAGHQRPTEPAQPPSQLPSHSPPLDRWDSVLAHRPGDPLPPPRAEVALLRGLSARVARAQRGRPWLVRRAALAVITVTFATAYLCQVIAPGFVDPALIQLVMMFTVIGVALVQRLLLHHTLPAIIWPCSAVMLAGACMVIVPTVGRGASAGVDGWRGWLGFGLSMLSMLSTVVYFVSLQASRRLNFTSLQLQYLFLLLSILFLLPLTLPVDGADWGAQFEGWGARDWAALVATSSLVCVGANYSIQHATWQLGAPTVSMFFGLRLVCSIVQSKLLLDYTIIREPVQIAGTAVTVTAVSVYLWWQWRLSRQQARSAAEAAMVAKAAAAGGQRAI